MIILPKKDKNKLKLAVSEIENMKGENTVVLDFRGINPFADYFLLTTCDSSRQLHYMAKSVALSLKKNKYKIHHLEGEESDRWVLLDCNELLVNIFSHEARSFYGLEELYRKVPRIELNTFMNGELND